LRGRSRFCNLVAMRLPAVLLALSCSCAPPTPPPGPPVDELPATKTPRWALRPWISKDISTGPDMREFLAGFQERDIPVGVAVLDSPWETHYNTFVPNEERYPDFAGFVQDFHDEGVRIVLWVTQMVNESSLDYEASGDVYEGESPNYREGGRAGYYVNDGETYIWWKGVGAAVDFFDEDASAWWRAQQTPLLELGVDGWKLDFGEQYITTLPIVTDDGEKSLQEYSEAYYADYWEHGVRTKGADDYLQMVRPYDASYGFDGRFYARRENAPVAWVGDQFRNWEGLVDALDHIFRSAVAGYPMLGSDIGGYLDRDVTVEFPLDVENFAAWTAMSAFMPLFQLHGRANFAPWTVPERTDEFVAAYRYWATLHDALGPTFYSLLQAAWRDGGSTLHPVDDDEDAWPGDWRFLLGDAFLIAPLFEAGGARTVALPEGDDWYDWWDDESAAIAGGTSVDFVAPSLREIPVYVKRGAIVPMDVVNDANGLGDDDSAGALTVLLFPSDEETTFTLVEDDDTTTTIALTADRATFSRATKPLVLLVRRDDGFTRVEADASDAPLDVELP
jgi:alpha-glucosidase (family GH31 glycosyl hydrolase)